MQLVDRVFVHKNDQNTFLGVLNELLVTNMQLCYLISGVTRGGRGGRVAHPWKVWGKFWKEGGK